MTRSLRDNLQLSPLGARNAIPLPVWSREASPRGSAMSVYWPFGTGNAGNSAVQSHRIRSTYETPPEPVAAGPEKLQQNGAAGGRQCTNSPTDWNKPPFMRMFKSGRESPLKL